METVFKIQVTLKFAKNLKMRMSIFSRLCLLILFLFATPSFASGFQTYSQEVLTSKMTLDCSVEKAVSAIRDFGALYICTIGKAKTARFFVSEKPLIGEVLGIGLIWDDWQIDTGYGVRADWQDVEKVLDFLIAWYVPSKRNDLTKAFWDSKNEVFYTSDFVIYYNVKPSPQKDRRIMVIQEK